MSRILSQSNKVLLRVKRAHKAHDLSHVARMKNLHKSAPDISYEEVRDENGNITIIRKTKLSDRQRDEIDRMLDNNPYMHNRYTKKGKA